MWVGGCGVYVWVVFVYVCVCVWGGGVRRKKREAYVNEIP